MLFLYCYLCMFHIVNVSTSQDQEYINLLPNNYYHLPNQSGAKSEDRKKKKNQIKIVHNTTGYQSKEMDIKKIWS